MPKQMGQYMYIEAQGDGMTVSLSANTVEYSLDKNTWYSLPAGTATPSVNMGERIYFRATGLLPSSSAGIGTFSISNYCNLGGNIMSLLFGNNAGTAVSLNGYSYAFRSLFYNCTTIRNVANDFLPATTLSNSCYVSMFEGCTSLVNAPELPATTLSNNCYNSMFYGCTGLMQAPELPATTLASNCYRYMFYGCASLNYIKALCITVPSDPYTYYWVVGVASTGTFVKSKDATWYSVGVSGVPNGWTVITDEEERGGG